MKTPDNFDALIREALKRSNAEMQHKLSPDFADRVMARLETEKVVPFYRRRPVWLSIAAAAAIAVAAGLFFLTQPIDKPTIAKTAPTSVASDTIATQAPEAPQQLMAEVKPEKTVCTKRQVKAVKMARVEATTPTANTTDDVQQYSEIAVQEAEQAIALLCKNLDKGIAYMEEAGNNIQRVNNNIEEITNKIINI